MQEYIEKKGRIIHSKNYPDGVYVKLLKISVDGNTLTFVLLNDDGEVKKMYGTPIYVNLDQRNLVNTLDINNLRQHPLSFFIAWDDIPYEHLSVNFGGKRKTMKSKRSKRNTKRYKKLKLRKHRT